MTNTGSSATEEKKPPLQGLFEEYSTQKQQHISTKDSISPDNQAALEIISQCISGKKAIEAALTIIELRKNKSPANNQEHSENKDQNSDNGNGELS
ncbi:MAG: hypothetical protein D6B27_11295 [Gammaproteobacteria bacterium]|nr:MAG: hypothetical protein D6B27_11295 [Gammaproteobacteria bacterium]